MKQDYQRPVVLRVSFTTEQGFQDSVNLGVSTTTRMSPGDTWDGEIAPSNSPFGRQRFDEGSSW